MGEAVPDWEGHESAWRALVSGLELSDPDDRHVSTAAIAGHANCIVTSKLKDFPAAVLLEYGIEAVDPDTFIKIGVVVDEYSFVINWHQRSQSVLVVPHVLPVQFACLFYFCF